MKTRLVRIGNSRGIRLPKPLIEEAGLSDEVEVKAREGSIVILPLIGARRGWAEAARKLRGRKGDRLVHESSGTRFDDEDWKW